MLITNRKVFRLKGKGKGCKRGVWGSQGGGSSHSRVEEGTSSLATLVCLLRSMLGLQGVSRENGLAKGFWEFMEFEPRKRAFEASESPKSIRSRIGVSSGTSSILSEAGSTGDYVQRED